MKLYEYPRIGATSFDSNFPGAALGPSWLLLVSHRIKGIGASRNSLFRCYPQTVDCSATIIARPRDATQYFHQTVCSAASLPVHGYWHRLKMCGMFSHATRRLYTRRLYTRTLFERSLHTWESLHMIRKLVLVLVLVLVIVGQTACPRNSGQPRGSG